MESLYAHSTHLARPASERQRTTPHAGFAPLHRKFTITGDNNSLPLGGLI
jgi:hypothetical protein